MQSEKKKEKSIGWDEMEWNKGERPRTVEQYQSCDIHIIRNIREERMECKKYLQK